VHRWNTDFAPYPNAGTLQLPAQICGVERFQQPRIGVPMHLNRQSNDAFGQFAMV
jgi:hypothetical protein